LAWFHLAHFLKGEGMSLESFSQVVESLKKLTQYDSNNHVNLLQNAIDDAKLDEINSLLLLLTSDKGEDEDERKTSETIAPALSKLDLSDDKIQKVETLIHITGQLSTIFSMKSKGEIEWIHFIFLSVLLKFDRVDFFKFIWGIINENNSKKGINDFNLLVAKKWFERFKPLFMKYSFSEKYSFSNHDFNVYTFIGKFNAWKIVEFLSDKIYINLNFLIRGFATSKHVFKDLCSPRCEKKTKIIKSMEKKRKNDCRERQVIMIEDVEKYLLKIDSFLKYNGFSSSSLLEKFNSPALYKYIVGRCQRHNTLSINFLKKSILFQTNIAIIKWLLNSCFVDNFSNEIFTISIENFIDNGFDNYFPHHLLKPENTQLLSFLILRASTKNEFKLFFCFFYLENQHHHGERTSLEILTSQYLRNPNAVENLFWNIGQLEKGTGKDNSEDPSLRLVKNNLLQLSKLLIEHCRFPQAIINYVLLSCF
jgi:hypothetical protein